MNPDWVPKWKPPKVRALSWLVGLSIFSLVVLAVSFLPSLRIYAIPSQLVSMVGLSVSMLGLYSWQATRELRNSVRQERAAGKAVWPIRVVTESKRHVRGLLELGSDGLEVRLPEGAASVKWEDLSLIEATEPGAFRGSSLRIEGAKSWRTEMTVLEANAVTEVGHEDLSQLIELVGKLAARKA